MEEDEYAPELLTTREDEKRWLRDSNEDKSTTASSSNIDSGFLSSGNLQTSGEICDSGLQLLQSLDSLEGEGVEDGPRGEIEKREQQRRAGVIPTTTTTTVSSSSSSTATTVAEPMRVDSGLVVDLGLSESLSQLSLKQVALNPLTGGRAVQATLEPNIKLTPVRATSDYDIRSDVEPQLQQQQQPPRDDNVVTNSGKPWEVYYTLDDVRNYDIRSDVEPQHQQEHHATITEEPWELYYTQDDDGDT